MSSYADSAGDWVEAILNQSTVRRQRAAVKANRSGAFRDGGRPAVVQSAADAQAGAASLQSCRRVIRLVRGTCVPNCVLLYVGWGTDASGFVRRLPDSPVLCFRQRNAAKLNLLALEVDQGPARVVDHTQGHPWTSEPPPAYDGMSSRRTAPLPPMIDSSVDCTAGDSLTTIKAQIMGWDDRYSGWFPLDNGGLSEVCIRQRFFFTYTNKCCSFEDQSNGGYHPLSTSGLKFEYTIFGKRIEDSKVLLQLRVVDDVNFCQMMPTFQSWQIGPFKFGLKFLISSDASKFRWRLQKVVEHTCRRSKSSSAESCLDSDELEDDVFMPVELPVICGAKSEPSVSSSCSCCMKTAPGSVGTGQSQYSLNKTLLVSEPTRSDSSKGGMHALKKRYFLKFLEHHSSSDQNLFTKKSASKAKRASCAEVSLSQVRQASDSRPRRSICTVSGVQGIGPPLLLDLPCSAAQQLQIKRESLVSAKLFTAGLQPLLISQRRSQGSLKDFVRREQCRHCKSFYTVEHNQPGCCPDAPDPFESFVKKMSCFWCFNSLLQRCSAEEAETPTVDGCCKCAWQRHRYLRWLLIALVTLFVPCMWCYLPLKYCRKACRRRCLLGSCHKPMASGSGF